MNSKPLCLRKYEVFIWNLWTSMWKLCLKPLNLYVEPLDLHLKPLRGTFIWNLWSFICQPLSETFAVSMYLEARTFFESGEPLCEASGMWDLLSVKPLCGTLGNLNLFLWNLCGTWNLLSMEPWGTWTFKIGTCMWNLGEPAPLWELLRVEPLCGTLRNLNF